MYDKLLGVALFLCLAVSIACLSLAIYKGLDTIYMPPQEIQEFTYNSHSYLLLEQGKTYGTLVHNPDCWCVQKKFTIEKLLPGEI